MKAIVSSVMGAIIGTVALAVVTEPGFAAPQSESPASAQTSSSQSSAGAQTSSPQSPAVAQPSSAAAADQVTITGCIQREADYRRSAGQGSGGVAGTGAGVANEFVLANAMMATSGSAGSTGTSGTGAPAATGTAGTSGSAAYELTGPNEGQAQTYVGKRVQVTGKMKASDAAGGPTGNAPGSQELKLREFEVSSIREASGDCKSAPSATP